MELITTDRINVVQCPACGFSEKQPFPFLATNAGKHVAVWYEPIPDPNIDADVALFRKHYGDDCFYAKAPRIKNWEEFKVRLIELNKGSDVPPTTGDFVKVRQGMRSAYAEATISRRYSTISSPITALRAWVAKLSRGYTSFQLGRQAGKMGGAAESSIGTGTDRNKKPSKSSSAPVSPLTKLEQAVSTWNREQARIALAIFAATIFAERAPLESLFGKGAKVETAIGRLTVSQLRVLYSIMTEIVPEDEDADRAG